MSTFQDGPIYTEGIGGTSLSRAIIRVDRKQNINHKWQAMVSYINREGHHDSKTRGLRLISRLVTSGSRLDAYIGKGSERGSLVRKCCSCKTYIPSKYQITRIWCAG